jgi:hypothetical protein
MPHIKARAGFPNISFIMKPNLVILMGLLCFNFTGYTDVFVYKNKITYTSTGGGGITRNTVSGWTILDDFGDVVQVLAFTAQKRYAIVPMKSIEFDVADAGAGKQYSYFLQHDVWNDTTGFTHIDTGGAKGLNINTVVNGTAWSVPKAFSWAGRSQYPVDNAGTTKFEESTGTFTFDKTWSATCNIAVDNIDSAAQRLATALTQQGYSEF